MQRTLSSGIVNELYAKVVRPILLVDMTFADNTYHFWTGVGVLTYSGLQYVGTGRLAKVEGWSETNAVEAPGISITLQQVDSTYLSESRNEITLTGKCVLSEGFLDAHGNVIDAFTLFKGFIDSPEIDFGAQTSSIKFNIETRFSQLNRSRGGRYTDADQKGRYSNDNSLKGLSEGIDRNMIWK